MAFQIPFPLLPQAYRYDLADVPALIAAFTLGAGPAFGVIVCRNLLHGLIIQPEFVGHLMNTAASGTLVVVAGTVYLRFHTRRGAAWAIILGVISATVVMIPLNILVLPGYLGIPTATVLTMTLTLTVPFNLSKGAITGLATWFLYKKVSPRLPHYTIASPKPDRRQSTSAPHDSPPHHPAPHDTPPHHPAPHDTPPHHPAPHDSPQSCPTKSEADR